MCLRLLLALFIAFTFVSVSRCEDPSPRSAYSALYDAWKSERDALAQATDLDDEHQRDQESELRSTYTRKFYQLAREHTAKDVWLECLMWVAVEGVPGADLDGMIDLMRSHSGKVRNSTQLTLFMSELISLESDRLTPALREMTQQHPSKGVRGAALYALAARTKILAERNGSPKGCKEAETLLRRVIVEYPDVRTYRGSNKENAERLLQELQSPAAIGKRAPTTKGKTLNGGSFDLADEQGKVIVLAFSGHWCGPCVGMHPIMRRLLNKYPREQLAIIEINSDQQDDLKNVKRTIEAENLHWCVVTDNRRGPISDDWNVASWPSFYVLDREQTIRRRGVGYLGETLSDWVDQLIEESSRESR